ncbi:CRISPR-associated endoribonuclease Cas6 [Runella slithyformis]|uniref:CRISPR-associated protein Cas6 n=1 Tax=Runella slithyformis (strain ATCC 29530 / DSM 19594 / LMG 11500 / NCIMB 11436 / LSU 4) TaxID=761193 RepID=A0A7U3ZQ32_RUNSL|nr:CRISPR-associated endoribonuclease Cas6 [Runella slithyformis]AEI51282.1 CRISPR-associated protein Cas6 [Runella slithyformis DSM 19594]
MRIHLKISANKAPVPFDHLPYLVGAFHKWLGQNELHGDVSLHSFSWLNGGKGTAKGLIFETGATWFISAFDETVIKQLIIGIQDSPEICFGMTVREIMIQETPDFESPKRFTLNSPVLLKGHDTPKTQKKHLEFSDPESDEALTKILTNKLTKAGLDSTGVKVYFDRTYQNAKTKLVNYRGIGNKASICPVIVEGTPEQIGFAWNVGMGHSTGIGFGALN